LFSLKNSFSISAKF